MTQPASQQHLSVVKPPLPGFEGLSVASVSHKIQGTCTVDGAAADVLLMDDRIRLVGDYRVIGVSFKQAANGEIVREHILKPVDLQVTPYNPSDPQDTGIWRSRPASVPQP